MIYLKKFLVEYVEKKAQESGEDLRFHYSIKDKIENVEDEMKEKVKNKEKIDPKQVRDELRKIGDVRRMFDPKDWDIIEKEISKMVK